MPLFKEYITNETFKLDFPSYIKREANESQYKWEKVNEDVVFTTNFIAAPRIAYCKYKDKFVFDLGRENVVAFVKKYYPNNYLKETLEEPYSRLKKSVQDDFIYNHIEFIENWSRVVVHSDGSFEKEDYPLTLYSVELKDAYDILHELLVKYRKLIQNYINYDNFMPTITGGIDTRALSSLWKDIYKGDTFFIKEVKNDGKNLIELGQEDLECATLVGEALGLTNHTNNRQGRKTLSGMYTDNINSLANIYLNEPDFVYKFIQHSTRWSGELRPFADDLYLQIKQPKKKLFRCLMVLLLCPELRGYPLVGTEWLYEKYGNRPYNFDVEFAPYIEEAQEILDYWGKDKCTNILNDDFERISN